MLSVVLLSAVVLSIKIWPFLNMFRLFMLSVAVLGVFMLSLIVLSVVAPTPPWSALCMEGLECRYFGESSEQGILKREVSLYH